MMLKDACQLALQFLQKAEPILAKSPLSAEAEAVRKVLAESLDGGGGNTAQPAGDWRKKTPSYTTTREGSGVQVSVRDGYDIKDSLKSAGFRWDGQQRVWRTRDPISQDQLQELLLETGMVSAGGETGDDEDTFVG